MALDSTALDRRKRPATHYVGAILRHPTSLTVIGTAAGTSLLCGIGLGAAIAALSIAIVILAGTTRVARVRRYLDDWTTSQQHQRRDRRRAQRVAIAGPARAERYRDIADVATEITRIDPQAAVQFDLEGLLDQFVALACHHHHCIESLRFAPSGETPYVERSRLRSDILTRRIRCREATARRIALLNDEMAAIEDLLHLIAHHVTLAAIESMPDLSKEVDQRLAEIDALEHAITELRSDEAA